MRCPPTDVDSNTIDRYFVKRVPWSAEQVSGISNQWERQVEYDRPQRCLALVK